jgi:adenosylhomocysteine nucleosidase
VNGKYSSSEFVCPAFHIYSLKTGGEGCRVCGGDANIMKIGIITAMPEETRSVVRAIGGAKKRVVNKLVVRQRAVAGNEIVIVEAGMGFDNAATAARKLICEVRPDLIISTGFCGGISMELQVGDIVVATGVTIVSNNEQEEVPFVPPPACLNFIARQAAEGRRVFGGMFTSTATIMSKNWLAALLSSHIPFPVVEMESAAIAIVAVENNIPFCGIRVVSDSFHEKLEFTLDEFCDDRMRIRIPRVLLTIARKPRIIPQLIRLAGNSRVAAASLSQAMERLLAVM